MKTVPTFREWAEHLAEQILRDMRADLVPRLPKYKEGWRYKEIVELIQDLKDGKPMRDDYTFEKMFPFCGDEIEGILSVKLHQLRELIRNIKKAEEIEEVSQKI